MDDIFSVVGKLYIDIYQTSKIIDTLQKKIKEQEEEIAQLKAKLGYSAKLDE